MNSSSLTDLRGFYHSGYSELSSINHITSDLGSRVVEFLLASLIATLLGSEHAPWHGVFYTSLGAWKGSVVVSFSFTALFGSSILLVDGLRSKSKSLTKHDKITTDDKSVQVGFRDTPRHLNFFEPLFYPSQTTHRRMYPRTHAFSYSYLLVGIPVLQESVNANSILSVHPNSSFQRHFSTSTSWFSVHASDYLQRGHLFQGLTLRTKLDLYLTSQNISSPGDTFPYAYLVTAPRFLGFSFNPVSFWYLYDVNERLAAMILEVNNTFDERRMYFLQKDGREVRSTNDDDRAEASCYSTEISAKRFTSRWRKDFHVSPFNDRDGSYSVNAVDVLRTGRVDVTIVLSDDSSYSEPIDPSTSTTKAHVESASPPRPRRTTKLIARIFSSFSASPTHPFDPRTFSLQSRLIFILRHGYIGFLTNPRILIEARKLWWNKRLAVFFRPEPFDTTIPRVETADETVIEERWREVLDKLGKERGVEVEYIGAAGVDRGRMSRLGHHPHNDGARANHQSESEDGKRRLKIHVLTPAFYSELTMVDGGDRSLESSFERFCFNAKPKEKMVDCSSADLLHVVLAETSITKDDKIMPGDPDEHAKRENLPSMIIRMFINRLRLSRSGRLLFMLRPPHAPPTSTFDKHVLLTSTAEQCAAYFRAVLTILLADRVALGSVALLKFQFRLLRIPLVLFMVTMVMKSVTHLVQVRHGSAKPQL